MAATALMLVFRYNPEVWPSFQNALLYSFRSSVLGEFDSNDMDIGTKAEAYL